MSVRVTPSVQAGDTHPYVHVAASTFALEGPEHSERLVLRGADDQVVAMYATGHWSSVEKLPEPEPVNAATPMVNAAEPDPRVTDPGDPRYGDGSRPGEFDPSRHAPKSEPGMDLPLIPDSGVLSETVEPYVSVNLSVTSDNSAEVVKVIKEALRTGKLTIPTKALA